MPYGETAQFELEESVERDVRNTLLNRLKDAIEGAKERNDDEADYDDLMEGAQMAGMPLPWPDACTLVSTIIPENVTTLQANLAVFLRQETLAEATARRRNDKEAARLQEAFIADVWRDEGVAEVLYQYSRNCLKSKSAVIYSGWCEKKCRVHKELYGEFDEATNFFKNWDDAAGQPTDLIEPEDRNPEIAYAEFPVTQDEVTRGGEYRVVDLCDFYPYPPNAESIEKATCVFERMLLTEDDLLTGIDTYGYDKEIVMDMIRRGPTHTTSQSASASEETNDRERQDRNDGIQGDVRTIGDGFYECFLGFGLLPKLWQDGESRIPEEYWQQEAQMLICYQHHAVPLLKPCPYPQKPYFMRSLLPKNRRLYGSGMVQRLEPLAQEATHLIRQTFNGIDYQMRPELIMTDEAYDRNPQKQSKLGKIWRADTINEIAPLVKANNAALGFEPLSYVDTKAQALSASQGYGDLQTKVRKNAEIQNTVGAANTKFDLYAWNVFGEMIPALAAWRKELQLIFDPDFTAQIDTMDGELSIDAKALRAPVRWNAAQMDSNNSPQAKELRNQAKLTIQLGFMQALREFPEHGEALWYGARQALLDLGDRNPEKWLGEKPKPIAPMQMPIQPPVPGMGAPPLGIPGGMPPMNGMAGMQMPPTPAMNGAAR
jgi:hypothetical protein